MISSSTETNVKTAAVLLIGNELLSGRTVDKNLPVIAERLNELGIDLIQGRTIGDDERTIVSAVNELRNDYDYVFTTGGIGPTHDDITATCVAKAFGAKLHRDPAAMAMLESHYEPDQLNDARKKMADVPVGAVLIENPVSKAPGFQLENVFVLAGVPRIMAAMLDFVMPRLEGTGKPMLSRTVASMRTEGEIAMELGEVQAQYPDVNIGSYPYFKDGTFGVSLVLRHREESVLDAAEADLRTALNL